MASTLAIVSFGALALEGRVEAGIVVGVRMPTSDQVEPEA